ncbi:MAG: TlyA family RNA methyltransferase [Acidimicrobiales bacterium]
MLRRKLPSPRTSSGRAIRRRLDVDLVRRGLAGSRAQAADLIARGLVLVSGTLASAPARLVDPAEPVVISGPAPRFVGRGGEKLDAALVTFDIEVAGRRALDAGSSTGGFTDCLLQRGVAEVVAVDVGRGQLHPRLRSDPRVRALERTDIRQLGSLGHGTFDFVAADLSFISLRSVARDLVAAASGGADMVLLVKPQFEVGRAAASRGKGVITEPALWEQAVVEVGAAYESLGATMMEVMVSPLRGAAGNVEFLVHLQAHSPHVVAEAPAPALPERIGLPAALAAAVSLASPLATEA